MSIPAAGGGRETERGSFWKTVPGVITGITALIGAVSGLIIALHSVGLYPAASAATPTPAVTSSAAPTRVSPARGALMYQVKVDGSLDAVTNVRTTDVATGLTVSPADAGVRPSADGLELFVRHGGLAASADLRFPAQFPLSYVGELELAATPNSDVYLTWTVRGKASKGSPRYLVQVRTLDRSLTFHFVDESVGRDDLLVEVPIAGGQNGARVTIAVQLSGPEIVLYIDGISVARVSDARVAAASGPPNIDIYGSGAVGGSVRILAARFYDLP